MKKSITIFTLFILTLSACKKDNTETVEETRKHDVSIDEAVSWLNSQADTSTILKKYLSQSKFAKSVETKDGNRIVIPISGQPTYQNVKQGYRQLSIKKNSETGKIEGKFLEIIPDAIYFQGKRRVDEKDFTGRIMVYDLKYQFQSGIIYGNGKQIGEAKPASSLEKQGFDLNGFHFDGEQNVNGSGKIMVARVIESCHWVTTTYIDAEGVYNIHGERFCTYYIYDDGSGDSNYNDSGINTDPSENYGGGGGNSDPSPPPPSNLPGEDLPKVDPKKMMECFNLTPDANAVYQVKVFVVEPLPGTNFNVGPNSFGHVAVSLTKASGGQLTTQTIGYYPTGTGFDKLVSTSQMIDNSNMEYNVSATYEVTAENFKKITNFIANPSANYHYTQNNCATFAYNAVSAGGINIPNATTQIAFGGYCITPAGVGNALRQQKRDYGANNIFVAGGRMSQSKGECK